MKRTAALLLTLVTLGATLSCRRAGRAEPAPEGSARARPADSAVAAGASPGPASATPSASAGAWAPPGFEGSIYDLNLTLTGHDGKPTPLDVFKGHPLLITMFYGSCPNACPLLTTDIKRLTARLSPQARQKLRVLMVSFDAARDTPEQLSRFMAEHRLDAARFKLASADEDPARELAAVLGIRYRKLETGAYFHTSAIILLDEKGAFLTRVEGLGADPTPILAALR